MCPELEDTERARRLLVVDDCEVNRLVLSRALEQLGHHVASVDSGLTAIDRLRLERFDMVLLDLEMPAMDGFALLEQLADDPSLCEVAVIVTSSLEGAAVASRCLALGADDYLHKPVSSAVLASAVRAVLRRRRSMGHSR